MDVLLFSGAGDEARTRYLHLGKVALYRMSYTRIWGLFSRNEMHYSTVIPICQPLILSFFDLFCNSRGGGVSLPVPVVVRHFRIRHGPELI